jgi:hypothetical protein
MRNAKALTEARKRWGKTAAVKDSGRTCTCGAKHCAWLHARYSVGKIELGMFFSVRGQGASWEEAFASADKAEAADKARYAAIVAARR